MNIRQGEGNTRWKRMAAASLLLHGLVFSLLFWVPGSGSYGGLGPGESVYSVSLVDGPPGGSPGMAAPVAKADSTVDAAVAAAPENRQAKKISRLPAKKDAVTIAKRTVEKSKPRPAAAQSTDNLLDKAISKVQGKPGAQGTNSDHLEKAIAEIGRQTGAQGGAGTGSGALSGGGGGGRGTGGGNPALRIYQMEVEVLIKNHWSYPDSLANRKDIEAKVLLKVNNDGAVLDSDFIKPSGNRIFDQSVLRAIEKAKPLPPLPEGYKKGNEEIELNFNLRDVK